MLYRTTTRSDPTRISLTTLCSALWRPSTWRFPRRVGGEEALEVLGEFEVGFLVDLGSAKKIEGGLLAGSQVGHASAYLIEGEEVFLVGLLG